MKFTELGLPTNILTSLKKLGYDEMTPIQEVTYPIISAGHDLCALAETGSGKTAACVIPLIQKVDPTLNEIQGLVLVPTRELCLQYVEEVKKIAAATDIRPFAVYGGFDKAFQISRIQDEVHILVATPGRLIDLVYDSVISFAHLKYVILDEADELLKVGFLENIEFILSCILNKHQTLLFSATMPDDIKKLAHDRMDNPQHISLITERAAPENLEHCFGYHHPKQKWAELTRYLESEDVEQALIFCNARYIVDELYASLRKHFKNIEYIHAGLSQDKRTSIFMRFKKQKIDYLVATDVAGRGLDFSHVTHVINWNLPRDEEQYTHRTGRTSRMGKKGKAFTFVTKYELPGLCELIRKKNISPNWIGENPLDGDHKPKSRVEKKRRHHTDFGKGRQKT
ncbi:MAG: DEAD/DEAH box helicase [Candidatus Anammoxibacter sp.]